MNRPAVGAGAPSAVLEARGVGKTYAGTPVLSDVDLVLRAGETLALVGANGAGKSTLVKILCGAVAPTSGEMLMDGLPVRFRTAADGLNAGIAVAHQQAAIIPCLTAAENIMLGREPSGHGLIRDRALRTAARDLAARFGVELDLGRECGAMPPGENKIIDILKALAHAPRVLVLDEPTASLTLNEARRLFAFLRDLKAHGIAIVYISHHLNEVFSECDRVLVLKDGRRVHEGPVAAITPAQMVGLMVGRAIEETDWASHAVQGDVTLHLRDARFGPLFAPSLDVHRREIVGIAGVLGAGQTELLEALAGFGQGSTAECLVNGLPGLPRSVAEAAARGVYLVAGERLRKAVFPGLSVEENLMTGSLDRISARGFVRSRAARTLAQRTIDRLRVRCRNMDQDILQLSGGNQQKVAFGRWLARMDGTHHRASAPLFLLDNPTEGVDVGSKAELYALIRDFARQGASVLIASTEFSELLKLCDRIYCIARGRVASCLTREAFSEDRLLLEVG